MFLISFMYNCAVTNQVPMSPMCKCGSTNLMTMKVCCGFKIKRDFYSIFTIIFGHSFLYSSLFIYALTQNLSAFL